MDKASVTASHDDFWEQLTKAYPRVPADMNFEVGSQLGPFKKHGSSVLSIKFSPDGRLVASAGGGRIPGCDDSIRIWDAATGKEHLVCHGHVCGLYDLAFHPTLGILASASEDYSVVLWNLDKQDAVFLVGGPPIVKGHVAFAETKPLLAVGETEAYEDLTASIYVIDLARAKEIFRHRLASADAISAMVFNRAGDRLTFAVQDFHLGGDSTIWHYDVAASRPLWTRTLSQTLVGEIHYSRDERTLIATTRTEADDDYEVQLGVVELSNGNWHPRHAAAGISQTVAMSPTEDILVYADDSGNIDLFDVPGLSAGARIGKVAEQFGGKYCSAQFSPDGQRIFFGDATGNISVYDRRAKD